MQKVDVFIQTTAKGPAIKKHTEYMYVLKIVINGKEPSYYVVDTCTNYTGELQVYSWLEDKDCEPEDGNDHMVNSTQYGWIPYRDKVGVENR